MIIGVDCRAHANVSKYLRMQRGGISPPDRLGFGPTVPLPHSQDGHPAHRAASHESIIVGSGLLKAGALGFLVLSELGQSQFKIGHSLRGDRGASAIGGIESKS